jgi:anti-anti-sigma factor
VTFLDCAMIAGRLVAKAPLDIDLANSDILGDELAACVPTDASGLNLDLAATRYLDSAGIGMLLRLSEQLSSRRQTLTLTIAADSPLRRLLHLAGVDRAIAIEAPD